MNAPKPASDGDSMFVEVCIWGSFLLAIGIPLVLFLAEVL